MACQAEPHVLLLCLSHLWLWAHLVARNRGAARYTLAALLAWHTCSWANILREGRLSRGYRATCGRTIDWVSFRVTREALANEESWKSPEAPAFGELWSFRAILNSTDDGQDRPYIAVYLARSPKPQRAGPPPLVEVAMSLGDYRTPYRVSRFDDWPYIEGRSRMVSHDMVLAMLEQRPHVTLAAHLVDVCACASASQTLFAAAEAAVLAAMVFVKSS